MTRLLILRHGPTAWNEAGRIQGRSDPPLSPAGRKAVAGWILPQTTEDARWICSPLTRARETAALLHDGPVTAEPRLIETDWGAWEGRSLAELRAGLGPEMAANEARGLDFRPPGGESPRDLQQRLQPLLAELAGTGRTIAAVAHKGVIRALYALASGWDMRGKPPAKLQNACLHVFDLGENGLPRVEKLNLPLAVAQGEGAPCAMR